MNLQQMEYIVALDKYRHFVLAAEACGVTQPTLSAMIQKLEEELDVKVFNRDRKNITPLPGSGLHPSFPESLSGCQSLHRRTGQQGSDSGTGVRKPGHCTDYASGRFQKPAGDTGLYRTFCSLFL